MKKILILILFVPNILFAQKTSEKPFKGATKIIITDTLSAISNFKSVGMKLNDLGYMISSKDETFGMFSTKPIEVKFYDPGPATYYQTIYITTKDNTITITSKSLEKKFIKLFGQYESNNLESNMTWKNDKRSEFFFENMLKIVKDIKITSIKFSE